jgi:hypothetical protein
VTGLWGLSREWRRDFEELEPQRGQRRRKKSEDDSSRPRLLRMVWGDGFGASDWTCSFEVSKSRKVNTKRGDQR